MRKRHVSSRGKEILTILQQLRVDGRRYVVSREGAKPERIAHDAAVLRLSIVSPAIIAAELLRPSTGDPEGDVLALHDAIERGLAELCALGLVRSVRHRPGLEAPITYARPDGTLVAVLYESPMNSSPAAGGRRAVVSCITAHGVIVGGYNVEMTHEMFELTPEGARFQLESARRRSRTSKRPKRTAPTGREAQALELYARRFTYEQIAAELGISKQRAEQLVKSGSARLRPPGRSVRAKRLPTDRRGQTTLPGQEGHTTEDAPPTDE